MKFNTKLIHGNFKQDKETGASSPPIYQTSAFRYETAEEFENAFKGKEFGYLYTRLNNPTINLFEKRMTKIEKGIGSVFCSSGMSAIAVAVMSIVSCGDEIVSGCGLFGGTHSLFENLRSFGVETKYSKDSETNSIKEQITDKTKLIFVETIGNPSMDVYDLKELVKLANDFNIPLVVDSTLTTPYLINPLTLGAHIVIHSTTKHINGSGNSIGGIIIDSGKYKWNKDKYPKMKEFLKFGQFAFLANVRKNLYKDLGTCNTPFNAYLTSIGLETLGLRVEKMCSNALGLAKFLQKSGKIEIVDYPGLENHRNYELAKDLYKNRFGSLLCIRVGTKERAFKIINKLKYFYIMTNLGETRSLIIHPASTIYAFNTKEEKEKLGVYEDLLRISLGIEDLEDLIEDFKNALN